MTTTTERAKPVVLHPAEVACMWAIESAARALAQMFGGEPDRWKLDGRQVTDSAAGWLLILNDELNTALAVRDGNTTAIKHVLERATAESQTDDSERGPE